MSKASKLRATRLTKAILKGYLFEAILKELLKKAGFDSDFEWDQLSIDRKKLHGRGAIHQIDLFGKFCITVPFIYPIMIIGEAKSGKATVALNQVRDFLGVFTDLNQYENIKTKGGPYERYAQLKKPRYTLCPVFFSLNGFKKSSEQFMFAHGISFVTYRSHPFIHQIYKTIEHLIKNIDFKSLKKQDKENFRDFNEFKKINPDYRKEKFDEYLTKLENQLDRTRSFVGVLDGKHTINVIAKSNKLQSYSGRIKLQRLNDNLIKIINTKNQILGMFSLSQHFIKYILKKEKYYENSFNHIDLIISKEKLIKISHLNIDKSSKEKIKKLVED